MKTPLVIASNNPAKTAELQAILHQAQITGASQTQWKVPPVDETGLTLVENAILKARHASQHTGLPALGDDSGLMVDALAGRPGIYSARFAGPEASDQENISKLLHELRKIPLAKRQAHFQCWIALLRHAEDPDPLLYHGSWYGRIALQPQGGRGFGYDAIFWVAEYQCTAAQLPTAIKNRISHRALALRQLVINLSKEV